MACNDLTHKVISQDLSGLKSNKKQKQEIKLLYDNFKRKTVNLNTLYARHIYQKLNQLFKITDVEAIMYYLEENTESEREYEYELFHDYFVYAGIDKNGKKLYTNEVSNDIAEKFFLDINEELHEAINEISLQFLDEEDCSLTLIKDMTFEDFLKTINLNNIINYTIDFDFSEFEEIIV